MSQWLFGGVQVVAVEGPEAWRLLGAAMDTAPSKNAPGVGTACLYFKAPKPARWRGDAWDMGEQCGRLADVPLALITTQITASNSTG
jgi:hypothetical protein